MCIFVLIIFSTDCSSFHFGLNPSFHVGYRNLFIFQVITQSSSLQTSQSILVSNKYSVVLGYISLQKLIVYISFITMKENQNYIHYLQNILKTNDIYFKDELQFQKEKEDENQSQINTENAPLKTNICPPLTSHLVQRYSRQMLLKQIAYEGQVKIVQAKVALIGSGGIGCPLALYLSSAGVREIGLFDSDTVDLTNLHRQIGHKTSTISKPKTQSLKNSILDINPHIKINEHPAITVFNTNLLDQYDLVIDGSDNPTCRYIVNDYCMKKGKKLLSGACIGWQAQITCYGGSKLCYRCLWGDEQVSLGGCSTLGVIGSLPGIVGMILATEAIKLILEGQSSLQGFMLTYDGRKCQFKKRKLRNKKTDCIGCGQNKLQPLIYDYAQYGAKCSNGKTPEVTQTTWMNFIQTWGPQKLFLDIRPANHYNIVHLMNSINIPYEKLKQMTTEELTKQLQPLLISQTQPILVSCTRGISSMHAVYYLNSLGFRSISIEGGILGYRHLYDRMIPQF